MFLHGLQQLQGGGLQCLKIARLAQQMAQHLCLVLMAVGEHALAHIEQVHACAGRFSVAAGPGGLDSFAAAGAMEGAWGDDAAAWPARRCRWPLAISCSISSPVCAPRTCCNCSSVRPSAISSTERSRSGRLRRPGCSSSRALAVFSSSLLVAGSPTSPDCTLHE